MAAVADASPLILFGRTDTLGLLRELFGELRIPPRVAHEVFREDPDRPGARAVATAIEDWITILTPRDGSAVAELTELVDLGEAEAIALAQEQQLLLIVDDPGGRAAATARRVPITGTSGVLGLAKREGLIPLLRPVLDQFIAHGLRLSRRLYAEILADAGESLSG